MSLPLLDIQTEAQNIAEGGMATNRVKLNILNRGLKKYGLAVDKAMSSAKIYVYYTVDENEEY